MESLPTEVKIHIFTCLSDLSSVKCLTQVSMSFNKAFMGAKTIIIREVVKTRIDPELLPEIVAVANSIQMIPWSRQAVLDLLDIHFSSRPSISNVKWDITTAVAIYQLQAVVKSLSADFASMALAKGCLTNRDGNSGPPPTRSELRRFERNFWKFELYCNLFRDREHGSRRRSLARFPAVEQKTLFLDRFAPFENEQLGCVHDYLWSQVSQAFDDVAAHDVLWGAEWSIDWYDDYYVGNSVWKEALLSRGLIEINMMRNAQTYEERYALVQGATTCPDFDGDFLVEALFRGYMDINNEAQSLEHLTLDQAKRSSKKSSHLEPDDGPIESWKWAYASWFTTSYFTSDNWVFRQRAHVMWDSARVVFWDLSNMPRKNLPEHYDEAYSPLPHCEEEQRRSRDARAEIYTNGGRGWWSHNDVSKIVWP